ncbi:hypothetical protein D3C73_1400320 [compost metagenome]
MFNIVEVTQHRLGRVYFAVGAEVPLQVADPKDHFSDTGGAWVDLQAEELVWVDSEAFGVQHASLA